VRDETDGDTDGQQLSLANAIWAQTGKTFEPAFLSVLSTGQLPKFKFQTRLELTPLLAGMGMPDLFDPTKANLSNMDGAMDLSVDTVVQQATVEVDESGTVATAVTSSGTGGCMDSVASELPPTILINQPVVFLIRDTRNGSILFMGQVENPSAMTAP